MVSKVVAETACTTLSSSITRATCVPQCCIATSSLARNGMHVPRIKLLLIALSMCAKVARSVHRHQAEGLQKPRHVLQANLEF